MTHTDIPMIYAHDIWKSYRSLTVLKGLTLSVPKGKTMVILGRSGVGKSVLLRQILGIEKPDRGYIEIEGVRITSLGKQELLQMMKQFGMLFQGSALFDSMTVGDNVGFYLYEHGDPKASHKLSESEITDRIATALKKVGLEGFESKMPSNLSGGQRKRAALARAIIYEPKILLYDEPTTGLDPITAMQINELIVQTQQDMQATSIVVTHDIRSALEVGDYFALHHDGKIIHVDKKERFLECGNELIRKFFENAIIPLDYVKQLNQSM